MDGGYYIGWGTLALINAGLAQGKKSKWLELVYFIFVYWTIGNAYFIVCGEKINLKNEGVSS